MHTLTNTHRKHSISPEMQPTMQVLGTIRLPVPHSEQFYLP